MINQYLTGIHVSYPDLTDIDKLRKSMVESEALDTSEPISRYESADKVSNGFGITATAPGEAYIEWEYAYDDDGNDYDPIAGAFEFRKDFKDEIKNLR